MITALLVYLTFINYNRWVGILWQQVCHTHQSQSRDTGFTTQTSLNKILLLQKRMLQHILKKNFLCYRATLFKTAKYSSIRKPTQTRNFTKILQDIFFQHSKIHGFQKQIFLFHFPVPLQVNELHIIISQRYETKRPIQSWCIQGGCEALHPRRRFMTFRPDLTTGPALSLALLQLIIAICDFYSFTASQFQYEFLYIFELMVLSTSPELEAMM